MSLSDELHEEEVLLRAERQQFADLLRRNRELEAEIDRNREILSFVGKLNRAAVQVPSWIRENNGGGGKRAIATFQFSDSHFDEVIRPEQIGNYNAYDRTIADIRLRTMAEGILKVAYDYVAGVEYDGMTVLSTGDTFSGEIHDELRTTNEGTLYEGVVYWAPRVIAWLKLMADHFKRVHVACAVGNHGRKPGKPIYKNRPQHNIEWLFWQYVASIVGAEKDERITFQIANGLSEVVHIYNTSYHIEHGDEFKGGSGISGAKAPLMLGQHRAAVQRLAMKTPIDWMVIGHFHQYGPPAQGLITGGSLKGYDEFAAGLHLRPERPQQGFWVTTPEHGPTISAPIFCDNRDAEGW